MASPPEPRAEEYDALLELAESALPVTEWAKVRLLAQEHRERMAAEGISSGGA